MYTKTKQSIMLAINASNEKATTINRVFARLIGSPKTAIKQAMKELLNEKIVVMRVAEGEAASMLNVQPGTQIYILNK